MSEPLTPHPTLTRFYPEDGVRRRRINAWFDESAPYYDRLSQIMSFGSGNRYRRDLLRRTGLGAGMRALDVATGTGVIARCAQDLVGPTGLAIGLDPSLGMLGQATKRGLRCRIEARAEALPLADASFDLLSMGYALRHVADLRQTFREYLRVLKPGGRVMILEITPPRSRLGRRALEIYMGRLMPALARLGGRTVRTLFEYYWETIDQCVPPETILAAMDEAGFEGVARRVDLSVFSEYSGRRPL